MGLKDSVLIRRKVRVPSLLRNEEPLVFKLCPESVRWDWQEPGIRKSAITSEVPE